VKPCEVNGAKNTSRCSSRMVGGAESADSMGSRDIRHIGSGAMALAADLAPAQPAERRSKCLQPFYLNFAPRPSRLLAGVLASDGSP
jgi:hypothetical protein